MKNKLKKILLKFEPINHYVSSVRNLRQDYEDANQRLKYIKSIISNSRSPGLCEYADDHLTDRLLAHQAPSPLPHVKLRSSVADNNPHRIAICKRLLSAYHKSIMDESKSPMKRVGEDLWSSLLRTELPTLMAAIDNNNAEALSDFLLNFGNSYVWFGGITTCIDGYNKNLKPDHIALTYHDKLICIAEYLGVIQHENPECGPWGENIHIKPDVIVAEIEKYLGISIAPPLGIVHTDGLDSAAGLFHYRHVNSLYSAIRLKELCGPGARCLEIGGGLGITAMYASRLGITNYTMLDLPITCLLAGNYLLNSLGLDAVSLYGEDQKGANIKLMPYWECLNLQSEHFDITLNQDSFPEIADNLLQEYLSQIKRVTTNYFLSINHEYFFPRTANHFVDRWTKFRKIYRSKYWIREGYVEELWKIT